MLDKAREKLAAGNFARPFHLEAADLNSGVDISNASVVMMVLTLQFIRPLYRERLLKSIWHGLGDNGCLIVVEKVLGENSTFNRLFIKHYYEMKMRNGYSELEIARSARPWKTCWCRTASRRTRNSSAAPASATSTPSSSGTTSAA